MIWLPLIFPVALVLVLLVFFRHKVAIWEPLVPILGTLLIIVFFRYIGIESVTKDTEYLGNYVTELRHYEDWDEWIHQTCYRTTRIGKTTISTPYDCSYRSYHPERWTVITNNQKEHSVSFNYWKELRNKFGSPDQFVELNRHYYTKDGDLYSNLWTGTKSTFAFYGSEHTYENRIQASTSIFNFEEITKQEKQTYNLYDYPEVDQNGNLPSILHTPSDSIYQKDQQDFDWVNGMLGQKKEVRVWVLLFHSRNSTPAKKQQSYWKGGNKNELVICIGVDDSLRPQWSHIFGWSKNANIKIEIRNFIKDQHHLDFEKFSNFVFDEVDQKWQRVSFKEFEYIAVEPPLWAHICAWLFSIAASFYTGWWIVNNDHI